MPLYLYPFLKTKDKSPQFEYLRFASLGVIGALVQVLHEKKVILITKNIVTKNL